MTNAKRGTMKDKLFIRGFAFRVRHFLNLLADEFELR
jgi:hypothetical protein